MSLTINYQLNSIAAGANASLDLSGNSAITVARGATSTRPVAPLSGSIRYNLDTNLLEYWNNTIWVSTPGFDSITGTADTMQYFTAGTAVGVPVVPAITPLTPFARSILDDTNAAAVRNTIAAANVATPNNWTGPQFSPLVSLPQSGAITLDFSTGNNFVLTAAGDIVMSNPINGNVGQSGIIFIGQDISVARNITWGNNWRWPGGTDFVLPATLGSYHLVSYFVVNSAFIVCTSIRNIV